MCWFLFECVAADPAHTHTRTHTGRPFLSSCRCGRVPNDIFYTLFFGFSFVPLDKPKARGEPQSKRNETSFIHLNSTHLTSAHSTQHKSQLPQPQSLPCLCLRLCPVNWFPLAAAAAAAVGRNFRFSSGRCTKLLIVGYAQVAPFPLCPFPPPPFSAQLICLAVADEVEFYDIFCTFRRGRATH